MPMNENMNKKQWHMGFCGAIELEFRLEKDLLEFNREFPLSKKPLSMDMLIIKKRTDAQLTNEIGRIFRKHNIFEYKSPEANLGVDQFFKGLAYACLYKSLGKTADEIKSSEITLTFVRDTFPRKLMNWLSKNGYAVDCNIPGIYNINGSIPFPVQIIISKELDNRNHLSLKALSQHLDIESAMYFVDEAKLYENQGDRENADAVLQISIDANKEVYDKILEDKNMYQALRELMKEKIDEEVRVSKEEAMAEGLAAGEEKGIAKGIAKGRAEGAIEANINSIKNLMTSLSFTPEQAMESIGIPRSEYAKYKKML